MKIIVKCAVLSLFWMFALTFGIGAEEKFVISENGSPKAVIQIPADSGDIVKFAASELKYHLDKMTGGDFLIVTEPPADSSRPRIILGDTPETRAAGFDVSRLASDVFHIHASNNTLFIAGKDDKDATRSELMRYIYTQVERGTLRGVYHFLQHYLGVRWVFPGDKGEYIPPNKNISLPYISAKHEPFMRMRFQNPKTMSAKDLKSIYGENSAQAHNLWMLRLGFSTWTMARSHYFGPRPSAARWVESNPEYFAINELGARDTNGWFSQGWKMCYSNPKLADEVAKDAIAYFSGQPASTRNLPEIHLQRFGYKKESFAINPSDADIACRCEECAKYRDEDGDYGELAWFYYKRVADEVAKHFPDAIISAWSYANHSKIPKSMDAAPYNTRIYLVTEGPFVWQDADERKAKAIRRMQDWMAFSNNKKLYIWVNMQARATRHQSLGGVPSPVPRAMTAWMKDIAQYMDGGYFDNSDSDISLFEASNTYFLYQLAWNPDIDTEELLADYYKSAYGPAGAIIRGMEEKFEDIWLKKFFGPRFDMGERFLGGKNSLPTTAEIWEDIYNDTVVADLKNDMAMAVAAAAGTPFEERVAIFERYYFGSFLEYKENYAVALSMADDMVMAAAKTDRDITIDGKMNEECWEKSKAVDMVVIEDDVKPKVNTLVNVLFDDEYLYVFFRCEEPEMARLRAAATPENLSILWRDDEVEMFLDPDGARKNHFQILVNTAGLTQEIKRKGGLTDKGWSSGAKIAAGRYEKGWTVEMAVPFSALDTTTPATNSSWVANFCRGRALIDPAPEEKQFLSWSRLVKGGFLRPQNFGRLFFTDDGIIPAQDGNLIKNGDFSKAFKHWGGKQCWIDKEERFLAEQSVRLEATKEDPSTTIIYRFPKGSLKPDTPYVLTFYIKTENVAPLPDFENTRYAGAKGALFLRGRGAHPVPEIALRGDRPWRKYVLRMKTEKEIPENASLQFRLHCATGKAWIENVVLTEEGK